MDRPPTRAPVAAELGEIEDGQTLNAVCPFCLGRASRHPVGGAKTMRFRLINDRLHDGEMEAVIACESGLCEPFAAECSLRVRSCPAWRFTDWEWLTLRLLSAP